MIKCKTVDEIIKRAHNHEDINKLLLINKTAKLINKLEKSDDKIDKFLLGYTLIFSDKEYQSYDRGSKLMLNNYDINDKYHLYALARIYYFGFGVKRDKEKMIYFYKLAGELNHPESLYRLGLIYYLNHDLEMNLSLSVEYYKRAAKYGSQEAALALACMYYFNEGVDKDIEAASRLLNNVEKDLVALVLSSMILDDHIIDKLPPIIIESLLSYQDRELRKFVFNRLKEITIFTKDKEGYKLISECYLNGWGVDINIDLSNYYKDLSRLDIDKVNLPPDLKRIDIINNLSRIYPPFLKGHIKDNDPLGKLLNIYIAAYLAKDDINLFNELYYKILVSNLDIKYKLLAATPYELIGRLNEANLNLYSLYLDEEGLSFKLNDVKEGYYLLNSLKDNSLSYNEFIKILRLKIAHNAIDKKNLYEGLMVYLLRDNRRDLIAELNRLGVACYYDNNIDINKNNIKALYNIYSYYKGNNDYLGIKKFFNSLYINISLSRSEIEFIKVLALSFDNLKSDEAISLYKSLDIKRLKDIDSYMLEDYIKNRDIAVNRG